MKLNLLSCGNPDFGQNPDESLIGCEPNKTVKVNSFKEASDLCKKFIEDNDLGSGNWNGGQIMDDQGNTIAHVSYNGRVWEGENWTSNTKEIKV